MQGKLITIFPSQHDARLFMVRSRETDRGVIISVVEAEQGHDQRPEDAKVQQESTWQACLPEVRQCHNVVT
jgi:hypothetical protein